MLKNGTSGTHIRLCFSFSSFHLCSALLVNKSIFALLGCPKPKNEQQNNQNPERRKINRKAIIMRKSKVKRRIRYVTMTKNRDYYRQRKPAFNIMCDTQSKWNGGMKGKTKMISVTSIDNNQMCQWEERLAKTLSFVYNF